MRVHCRKNASGMDGPVASSSRVSQAIALDPSLMIADHSRPKKCRPAPALMVGRGVGEGAGTHTLGAHTVILYVHTTGSSIARMDGYSCTSTRNHISATQTHRGNEA